MSALPRFGKCPDCGRLNLYSGNAGWCVCAEPVADPPINCDCTYTGNTQHIGPKCRKRIDDVWADAIQRSRAIVQHIKETP